MRLLAAPRGGVGWLRECPAFWVVEPDPFCHSELLPADAPDAVSPPPDRSSRTEINSSTLNNEPTFLEKTTAALRRAGRETWLFLSSGIFLKNLALMLAVVGAFVLGLSLWLGWHTDHGESQAVPDFVGNTYRDARRTADAEDLRLTILDSIWRPDIQGRTPVVLEQTPRPAARVKKNRNIYLTVTKTQAPEVLLPPFKDVGYAYGPYSRMLARNDIETTVEQRQFDARQADESILSFTYNGRRYTEKDVAQGLKIPKGSALAFTITSQTSNSVVMPDLRCESLDQARFILDAANLQIGELNGPDASSSYVWRTDPPAGTRVAVSRSVTLFLQRSYPVGCP